MSRFLFSLIPWWMFAIIALTFAPVSVELYQDYRTNQAQMQTALAVGPPPVTPTQSLNPTRSPWPFGEVRVDGTLRADVGILSIVFGETEYRYVLIDNAGNGAVVAILTTAASSERMFTQLVEGADATGRVTVQGFLAPSRAAEISRRLTQRGVTTGGVYVVEPFFGSRNAVLSGKVQDTLYTFLISAAFTALFAVIAIWRFRRWRMRRAQNRGKRAVQAQTPAPTPVQPQMPSQKALPSGNAASPWGTSQRQDRNVAPQNMARMDTPQKTASGQPVTKRAPAAANTKLPAPEPEFKSVFPGGGSGFRFKTADMIIRQSFGTLSNQNKGNRDDP